MSNEEAEIETPVAPGVDGEPFREARPMVVVQCARIGCVATFPTSMPGTPPFCHEHTQASG